MNKAKPQLLWKRPCDFTRLHSLRSRSIDFQHDQSKNANALKRHYFIETFLSLINQIVWWHERPLTGNTWQSNDGLRSRVWREHALSGSKIQRNAYYDCGLSFKWLELIDRDSPSWLCHPNLLETSKKRYRCTLPVVRHQRWTKANGASMPSASPKSGAIQVKLSKTEYSRSYQAEAAQPPSALVFYFHVFDLSALRLLACRGVSMNIPNRISGCCPGVHESTNGKWSYT